jgi:3-deoxy-D-manno-octulosonic-acid transferase
MKPEAPLDLPWVLRIYRAATGVFASFAWAFILFRRSRGREDPKRWTERRGYASAERARGPLVWLHGASVGEIVSALPIAHKLAARGINTLITSGTVTSASVVANRLPAGSIHQYIPVDTPQHMARFLQRWRPTLAVMVESELWPAMITEVARRRIPLILVNGRMSDRSFRRWKRLPRAIGALLQRFDLLLVQTRADAERFSALGADRVIVSGNLKFDATPPVVDAAVTNSLRRAVINRRLFVAASTHVGEDAVVLDAHARMRGVVPGLITVIAPRHPERGAAIVAESVARGFRTAQRSAGQEPDADTEVYVADTIGELGVFYRLARVALVGGSLVPHGGQNPIEPAKLGCAILHGPHTRNFAEVYAALDGAGGARLVLDVEDLAIEASSLLLKGIDEPRPMTDAATRVVDEMAGALDRTMAAMEPYLLQIDIEKRS